MGVLAHIGLEGSGLVFGARTLKEVAEPLRPRNRRRRRRPGERLRVDPFREFGEQRRDLAQATGMMLVADEVKRSRFRSRHQQRAARRVETLDRYFLKVLANHEGDAHPAGGDGTPALVDKYLK